MNWRELQFFSNSQQSVPAPLIENSSSAHWVGRPAFVFDISLCIIDRISIWIPVTWIGYISVDIIAWPALLLFPVSLVHPSVPESYCLMTVAFDEWLVFLGTFLALLESFFPDDLYIHVVKLKNEKESFWHFN